MQSSLVDRKLSILYDKYKDREYVKNAQKEVEDIRRTANYTGAAITTGALVLNEAVRLTKRSPLFKLKVQNLAFWVVAPTLGARYFYENHIHERVDNLWRIHVNRERQGLGGTYKESGLYDDKMIDHTARIYQGAQISMRQLVTGEILKPYLNNQFQRFNKGIEAYPDFLDDMDDIAMVEYDNFERLKPYAAKEGTTVGSTPILPIEDTDTKPFFYDIQGESLYTNPPDTNSPTIDHGIDEDDIWSFQRSVYNQIVIKNPYTKNIFDASTKSHAPYWGNKLQTPAFYKDDKFEKFLYQWNIRLGLEQIKMKHAATFVKGDKQQQKNFKNEIMAYLEQSQNKLIEYDLKDVVVTDHIQKPKRYHTNNSNEDQQFYNYQKSLESYLETPSQISAPPKEKYPRGSALQVILDPFAGQKRLPNGALFYEVQESELLPVIHNDDKLRAEWEKLKEFNSAPLEFSEEESDELQYILLQDLEKTSPNTLDEFNEILDQQFSVFKDGETYNFVKDMKNAFEKDIEKPLAEKIFDTIPAHYFWDIKTPRHKPVSMIKNPYNPFRQYPFESFFDHRSYEEYMDRREKKENLRDGLSLYRRY
ncbi:UNKNOWN [Stylonychia lemnae]|uniref:Uncharacterized protein n=1 Tax=Stylonychia lemnae TaxID=5949 RepID=A0A078A5D2_STYLE|nr:UNKNOWN [Stylonychia lemnae]|eukprot:CDW76795.1 UNKNOWN [Stylonychia lemnae]